jgi:hypothetical protein
MISSSIHVVRSDRILFSLYLNSVSLYCYMAFSLSSHPLIKSLVFFHSMTNVNSAIIKKGVQQSIQHTDFISFGYILRSGILLYDKVVLLWSFEESPYCFPQWLQKFTFPPTVSKFPFSTFLWTLVVFSLSDNSHSYWVEMITCGFDLHFHGD